MKYFYLLFFIFVFTNGFSQSKKIWILDSLTHKPVYDVLVHTSEGNFYSNLKGFIIVDSSFAETIQLIHTDYKTKVVILTSSFDTLYLVKNPFLLEEVNIIQQKEPHFIDIGYYNRSLFNHGSFINNLCILAVSIPYSDTETYINKILLRIKAREHSEDYNVYLYQPDSTGKPGRILYKKNIIVDSLKKEGIINVQDLDIKMPENGIFVGL